MMTALERDLDTAERKAWEALAKYKFMMFGYWAAIWVHQNRVGGFKRPNPWIALVKAARTHPAGVHQANVDQRDKAAA